MSRQTRPHWKPKEDRLLRKLYPKLLAAEVATRIGRPREAIYRRATQLGITKSTEFHLSAASGRIRRGTHLNGRRPWTSADEATLRELYPSLSTVVVAARMGRTVSGINGRAEKLKLHKTPEYLASPAACRLRREDNPGVAYRFPKGHVPMNKGMRRPGWGPGRMRETQFKKGQRLGAANSNWRPVGTEVVDDEGYRKRKVADDPTVASRFNWKFVHVLLWEKKHGKVPAGHAIAFKNGNQADIRLENLECISRGQLMARNTVHNLPTPVAQVVQLRGQLHRKIRRLERAHAANH